VAVQTFISYVFTQYNITYSCLVIISDLFYLVIAYCIRFTVGLGVTSTVMSRFINSFIVVHCKKLVSYDLK